MHESASRTCLNCDSALSVDAKYCVQCGQKVKAQRSSVAELLSDAFSNITNLDNALWQTVKVIWQPGKLTQEYFAGRRKNYITPIRLFLVSALFFFAAMNTYFGDFLTIQVSESKDLSTLFNEVIYHQVYQERLDSIIAVEKAKSNAVAIQAALDSTSAKFANILFSDSLDLNTNVFDEFTLENADGDTIAMTVKDLTKSPEAFIAENKIEGFWVKTLVQQAMRFIKNPDSLLQFIVSHLTWMFLLLMPVSALVLKLLYWRRGRFYIEHLVFTLHLQSFFFLFFAFIFIVVPKQIDWMLSTTLFLLSTTFLYLFLAFRSFYGQGLFKIIFKQIIYILTYFYLFATFLMFTLFISALVF